MKDITSVVLRNNCELFRKEVFVALLIQFMLTNSTIFHFLLYLVSGTFQFYKETK
jgi:hypothetical protein